MSEARYHEAIKKCDTLLLGIDRDLAELQSVIAEADPVRADLGRFYEARLRHDREVVIYLADIFEILQEVYGSDTTCHADANVALQESSTTH